MRIDFGIKGRIDGILNPQQSDPLGERIMSAGVNHSIKFDIKIGKVNCKGKSDWRRSKLINAICRPSFSPATINHRHLLSIKVSAQSVLVVG